MYKRNVSGNMVLSLAMGLILSFCMQPVFADETLTITTYYPSPYGSYSQLQANLLSVGDTNADSQMTSADLPPANGQIYAARGIILKPQSSLPSTNLVTGELVYNDSDKKLYSYDGSAWVALGGSAGSSGVTMISARSAATYNHPNACAYCYNLSAPAAVAMNGDTTTVYTDWRIPTVEETAVFEGVISEGTYYYWTASFVGTVAVNWAMRKFTDGYWNYQSWDGLNHVRCVR